MKREFVRVARTAALVGWALGTLGRPVQAQTHATDSAAIHDASRRFSAAYVRSDAAAMADVYSEDAVIFPGRSDRITGRQAITRYWTLPPGRRVSRHEVRPASLTIDGSHAYEYGIYEIAGAQDGAIWGPVRGKYVAVWRRESGKWRLLLDIWNSGPPNAEQPKEET